MFRRKGVRAARTETAKLTARVAAKLAKAAAIDLPSKTAGTLSLMTSKTSRCTRNTPNEAPERVTSIRPVRGEGAMRLKMDLAERNTATANIMTDSER